MATKKKIVKAESINGKRTRRFASRPGYAERITPKKVKRNADDDAAKNNGNASRV